MTALLAEQQRRRQLAGAVAAGTTSGRALQSVAMGIATTAAELGDAVAWRSDHSAPAFIHPLGVRECDPRSVESNGRNGSPNADAATRELSTTSVCGGALASST